MRVSVCAVYVHVCVCVRVVCACMCRYMCVCISMCVFVNCVWILSSKNDIFKERNSSVWDDTYHSAGNQRYVSRVEVMLVELIEHLI